MRLTKEELDAVTAMADTRGKANEASGHKQPTSYAALVTERRKRVGNRIA